MREFYLMVGLAGSGKSTIAKEIEYSIRMSYPKYDEYGRADKVVLISSDDIRAEILGDVNDQSQNDKVFSHVHKLIKQAVKDYNHIRSYMFCNGFMNMSDYDVGNSFPCIFESYPECLLSG